MAKKTNARRNDARDTPIKRAAQEIAAARSKARSAEAKGAMPQKRVTRSSGLLILAAGGARDEQADGLARSARGDDSDEAEPSAGSSEEDASDAATARKKSTGRPSQAASEEGVSSGPKAARGSERSPGAGAAGQLLARKPRTRRGQAASSDSDEASAKKVGARDEAMSSDEGDCSDALTGELARRGAQAGDLSKKKGGGIDQLHELERKLKKAEEKNRILARGSRSSVKAIPKPKGSIGQKGYSLIQHMRLDPEDEEEKDLYNNILASVRALAHRAGLDFDLTYGEQPTVRLANLFLAAREKEPYLKRFSDDWATGEILRQFINGKRKGEKAKAKPAAAGRGLGKRKGGGAQASGSNKRAKGARNGGRESDEEEA